MTFRIAKGLSAAAATAVAAVLTLWPCVRILGFPEAADTTRPSGSIVRPPMKAMLRSAVVPGWGQWWNGQKLKAVVVFGAEAALVGNAVYAHTMAGKSEDDDETLYWEDVRSQSLWWAAGVYLLGLLDAFVDATLYDFDTGPDLSFGPGNGGILGIARLSIPLFKP